MSTTTNTWKTQRAGGIETPLVIFRGTDDEARASVEQMRLPIVHIGGIPDDAMLRRDPCCVRIRIWIPALPGRDGAMIERDRFVYGTMGDGPRPPAPEKVDAAAEELAKTVVQYMTRATAAAGGAK